jgi:hypothetical protein
MSKEAQHGNHRPPPRQPTDPAEPTVVVPLEQLWTRMPPNRRQELLGQLTRILAQRLAPPSKEEADE